MNAQALSNAPTFDPTIGEGRCAHIIAPTAEKTGVAIVTEARVYGLPVTALCGHVFVPERDPKTLPMCSRCREIREAVRPDENPDDIPA